MAITAAPGSTRRRPRRRSRERSRERLDAEQAWTALGARAGKPVAILRLSGIYGPGQNALMQVARGSAKRIDKPGQVFNRIHVADIAQAIDAAFARRADGIFNVTDDEPTPQGVPIAFAADLLGVAPPPEIPFAEAAKAMTPMALSFYGESKRVRNAQAQVRAWRRVALSDLSRRSARTVRARRHQIADEYCRAAAAAPR